MVAKARFRAAITTWRLESWPRRCSSAKGLLISPLRRMYLSIYVGDLTLVFDAAARALRPGGVFAFSVEAAKAEEGEGYVLRSTGRYAHAQAHVAGLAARFGFEPVSCVELCIRQDGNQIRLLADCLGMVMGTALTLGIVGDMIVLRTRNVIGLAIAHFLLNVVLAIYLRNL